MSAANKKKTSNKRSTTSKSKKKNIEKLNKEEAKNDNKEKFQKNDNLDSLEVKKESSTKKKTTAKKKSNSKTKKIETSEENKNTLKSEENKVEIDNKKDNENKQEISEKEENKDVNIKSKAKTSSKKKSSKSKKGKTSKKQIKSNEEENKAEANTKNNKKTKNIEEKKEVDISKKDKNKKSKEEKILEEELKEKEILEKKKKIQEQTAIGPDGKPIYVKEMIKNKRMKMILIICIILAILLILAFSTCFALVRMNDITFAKGIQIRRIDVSGLTIDEGREKITSLINAELMPELQLKYNKEYKITLSSEQIGYKYNIEDAMNEAYNIGRDGKIFANNYNLLFTAFFGKEIDLNYTYNEEFLNSFVDDISSKIPGLVIEPSYYVEDSNLIIAKGKDGIQVEREKLKEMILEAFSNRKIEDVSGENYSQSIDIPVMEQKASSIDIDKVYSEVHREPKDAYFETDPYKIYADVDGIDFNISIDEAKNMILAEDKEEYEIPLKITKASKTINDIGKEAFPYEISKFSTKYDASNTNRSTNLKIAADKINGTVLMPGEVFSFNKVVGKRTVEDGYKDAKIYADGGVVDGLAGGICQISSTLYNAVLLANLEIVQRRNHSYPTSYVAVGRDATVVWGSIDFQFKNSRLYPVKIEASVKSGIAEFKIHGMQEENEYEIRILPVTTQSIPYSTTYTQDASLAPGQQVVVQSGHAGYKVTTYLEKRLNGNVVSKEVITNDTYTPMRTIIRTGPAAPAPVPVQ